MSTLTVEDVQARMPELLDRLGAGEEVLITRDGKPVARLIPSDPPKGVPVLGRGQGKVLFYIDDDEHLKDFADYMP